jgi:ribosomal protein S2
MQKNLNVDTLVSENCLILGQKALSKKNNNKNIFILGNRNKIEVFKKNRIRFLLLKLYPLISGFYRTQLAEQDIKILFATTTKSYKQIIKEAALLCGMPYSNDRWLCGSITAILRKTNDRFNIKLTREEKYIDYLYQKKYKKSLDITKSQDQLSNR